jgi:hypothetical protein
VGDECVRCLGEEDSDAIIEGLMKVRAKEEAVGNIPGHVDVVRYLIRVPYLHVITQVPRLFFLRAELRNLSKQTNQSINQSIDQSINQSFIMGR